MLIKSIILEVVSMRNIDSFIKFWFMRLTKFLECFHSDGLLIKWSIVTSTCIRVSLHELSLIPVVILIGDVFVGKTCLLTRYLKN